MVYSVITSYIRRWFGYASKQQGENVKNRKNSKSNGIGIYNVLERLQMYYTTEDVLEIKSDGEGKGTRFTLKIPKEVRP